MNARLAGWCVRAAGLTLGAALAGCGGLESGDERNAFLTYTEEFGATSDVDEPNAPPGGGGGGDEIFRATTNVTLVNTDDEADLNVALAAWILPSSIRSADQADQLLTNGYVQVSVETKIGSVFTLPAGTFVLNGGGDAGAFRVVLRPENSQFASERTFSFITPDVVLVYYAPPTSCDSPAFVFTIDGQFPDNIVAGTNSGGTLIDIDANTSSDELYPVKTLRQIDVYDCSPLRPGLFLKSEGGVTQPNEFFEGSDITFTFSRRAQGGTAATATIAN